MKKTKLLIVMALVFAVMISIFSTTVNAAVDTSMVITDFLNGDYRNYDDNGESLLIQIGDVLRFRYNDYSKPEYDYYTIAVDDANLVDFAENNTQITAKAVGSSKVTLSHIVEGETLDTHTFTLRVCEDVEATKFAEELDKFISLVNYRGSKIEAKYLKGAKEQNKTIKAGDSYLAYWEISPEDIIKTDVDLLNWIGGVESILGIKQSELLENVHYTALEQGKDLPVTKAKVTVLNITFAESATPVQVFYYDHATKTYEYAGVVGKDSEHVIYNVVNGHDIYALMEQNDVTKNLKIGDKVTEEQLKNGKPLDSTDPAEDETTGAVKNDTLQDVTSATVVVDNTAKSNVEADKFATAKKDNKEIKVLIPNKIAWEFSALDLNDKAVALNPYVEVSNTKFNNVKTDAIKEGTFIDFSHSGNLPGKAKVTLNIGTAKFGNGSKTLHLYYYNPTTSGYEYQGTASYNKGVAKFELLHCSTYVLVENRFDVTAGGTAVAGTGVAPAPAAAVGGALDNEPKAGEVSILPVALLSVVSLAVAVVTKK